MGAKIGGGGMATVYLGHDRREDGTEELVALKVIRDELANDETFSSMFIDEAKILSRLSHPNVIQTLEYGVSGSHRFIAMELLNGRTVADAWDTLEPNKEDRFELGDAAWICARVAEGLHSAHELVDETGSPLGVIHRDVNPSNIFLTHGGEVKLIDFGLARARVRVSKSAEGIIKGKIPYLAPEQAHGRPIDRRIDIYALGTTLWEMTTMKRLFKRDTDIDTLKAIRDAKVPDPRETNPDFPDALWKIIERALKIDRDERYASAEEMRADLDGFARASGPHGPKVATLVSRLFPGGEERMAEWLQNAAASVEIPAGTMAPPAPLPIASSSLLTHSSAKLPVSRPSGPPPSPRRPPLLPSEIDKLEELEAIEAPPSIREVPGPAASVPLTASQPVTATSTPSTAPKTTKKKVAKASKKDPRVPKKKKKKRPDAVVTASRSPDPAPPPPPEDKKTLWMWVVGTVVLLAILAAIFSR